MPRPADGRDRPLAALSPDTARGTALALPPQVAAELVPSGDGRLTVVDAAADRGAGDAGLDSDGDASMIDPDQFLETELASGKSEAVVDEDLTPLSWLHDKDLLKGIQLRPAAASGSPLPPHHHQRLAKPEPEEESPTSDYLEEAAEGARSADESPPAPPGRGKPRPERFNARRYPDHQPYSYDPKVHVHFKPPFSFSCLIFMAIEDSCHKALPVKEIYFWIQEHFPFYRTAPVGWKNSVRHNLSLNKCFRRIEKARLPSFQQGKGSFWTVEDQYRANLLETLRRSPCVFAWKCGNDPRGKPWAAAAAGLGEVPVLCGRLRMMRTRGVQHTYARRGAAAGAADRSQAEDGGPDPKLFPFLAARLMAGPTAPAPPSWRELPDAPPGRPCRLLTPRIDKTYLRLREGHFHDVSAKKAKKMDTETLPCFQRVIMISRSASEDHTYAYSAPAAAGGGDPEAAWRHRQLTCPVSEDEAFSDDSNLSHELRPRCDEPALEGGRSGDLTPEEVEGADLLLNLAGVSRAVSPPSPPPPATARPRRRLGRPGPLRR